MKKVLLIFALTIVLVVGYIPAQQSNFQKHKNIFEELAKPDSISQATVRVHQDKRIEQLMLSKNLSNTQAVVTASGYRVQVFSSNAQRTAKNEAFRIEKNILEVFPDQGVYVNYISPFWKVRVGDFRTQAEAQAFRKELIEAFPHLRSEIYIVRERIQITGSK